MSFKINKIHHVAIICSNYAVSLSFYIDTLGFSLLCETFRNDSNSYKADLSLGGSYMIELFSFPNPPPRLSFPESTGLRHLAFEVDSIEETRSSIQARGVLCEDLRIDPLTNKTFFFILDPDGLPLEFYES